MSRSPKTFKTGISVRGYEQDAYGHVNNAVYLNYFEHGRWELFRELKLTEFLELKGLLIVVTDVHVRYMREAVLFDRLEIQTRVSIERPYLVFRQKLVNRESQMALARAETKTVFLDQSRKPVDVLDSLTNFF
jgi:acyl-CoA thioester hydrolase